jgi:hypothetical protein
MPKLQRNIQEPFEIYPAVEDLNENNGLVPYTLEDMPFIDPEKRINLARLARAYGNMLGPMDGVTETYDHLLDVAIDDFGNASKASIKAGLFIPPHDDRYHNPDTEQLVRTGNIMGDNPLWGVVFPADQFKKVARSPRGLAEQRMAVTRDANKDNPDDAAVDATVGRSAGHVMERYIPGMVKLDDQLDALREKVLLPLHSEARFNWQAHYNTKAIDLKFKIFVEEMHNTLDTASLNLNIGTVALKAAHRALTSNLTRRGSASEQNAQLQEYVGLSRQYVKARRKKINLALKFCGITLETFQPYLDAKAEREEAAV